MLIILMKRMVKSFKGIIYYRGHNFKTMKQWLNEYVVNCFGKSMLLI